MFLKIFILTAALTFGGSVNGWAKPQPQHGYNQGILSWCNSTINRLREYQRMANITYSQDDNGSDDYDNQTPSSFTQSVQIFRAGLVDVKNQLPNDQSTGVFTARAINRAIRASDDLAVLGNSILTSKAHAQFLNTAYENIISIATYVDIPKYQQFVNCGCNNYDIYAYEQALLESAARSIELPVVALTHSFNGLRWPFGDQNIYFKTLERYAYGTAYDLSRSGYSQTFACTIRALVDLGNRMAYINGTNSCSAQYNKQFQALSNLGTGFLFPAPVYYYPNVQMAVRWSAQEALYLAQAIRSASVCGFAFDPINNTYISNPGVGYNNNGGIYQDGKQNNGTTVNIINSKKVKVKVDNKNESEDEVSTDY